eukprot:Skav213130  [mRNA]  locus=scaffold107:227881:230745:+ [translate_table: standard]
MARRSSLGFHADHQPVESLRTRPSVRARPVEASMGSLKRAAVLLVAMDGGGEPGVAFARAFQGKESRVLQVGSVIADSMGHGGGAEEGLCGLCQAKRMRRHDVLRGEDLCAWAAESPEAQAALELWLQQDVASLSAGIVLLVVKKATFFAKAKAALSLEP